MALQTEFQFTLPKGYVDKDGGVHRSGTMRLATANDEIAPLKDPRVKANQAYLVILLLSRVITRLGDISSLQPNSIEGLFSADLAFLQDFYRRINETGSANAKTVCPTCDAEIEINVGELQMGDVPQTEFPFTLPRGYIDKEGNLHKEGVMRLATANDEIAPLRDPRVKQNQAYLDIILLTRVITRLGTLAAIHTGVVEGLFSHDLRHLQDTYRKINEGEDEAKPRAICPECGGELEIDLGELQVGE